MNLTGFFINPETRTLRSGWRAVIFIAMASLPQLLARLFLKMDDGQPSAIFEVSLSMIVIYALLVAWIVFVSWLCLRFLEGLNLATLGLSLYQGWWRDVLKGSLLGALMVAAVVGLQFISGGTRVTINSTFGSALGPAFGITRFQEIAAALVLLALAGAFEELAFRGYAFQTLLRGTPAIAPIALFSLFFAIGHWGNPGRTVFSTVNTVLAGVWLSMAYLKTRSLWFPTALHFTWNFMMGPFFGLPVSGLLIPRHPILISTSGDPLWVTGGVYGSEGGAAATLVLIIAAIVIWRARWLKVAPNTQPRSMEAFRASPLLSVVEPRD